jgi:hypothetical protein
MQRIYAGTLGAMASERPQLGIAGDGRVPDLEEVSRIVELSNPVIRNLEITQCYSRLAAAVVERSYACSNWCTFATWASRQAGRTIRGEDLIEELERELARDAALLHPLATLWRALVRRGLFQPDTRLGRLVAELHTPFDAFEFASDAVARGNRKVFAEIGREFARYLQECGPDMRPDSADFERFLEGLRPGDPPEGQRYLRQAFTRYQQQRFEPDPKRRAELIVLASLEIGLHEQTRLQPEIRAALDAATTTDRELAGCVLQTLFPRAAADRRRPPRPVAAPLHLFGSRVQRELSDLSHRVITRCFMVLTLPGAVLALGEHLDAAYPDVLQPPAHPDLEELLARFEPVAPALDDCAARDWSEFTQRMHYISHLFRAYHEQSALASAPFTPAQVDRFRAGTVPDGEL